MHPPPPNYKREEGTVDRKLMGFSEMWAGVQKEVELNQRRNKIK